MSKTLEVSTLLVAVLFVSGVSAQTFVYPAKGQSTEQQKKDEGECHTWAVGQSKYDPAIPPPQTAAAKPPTAATGSDAGRARRSTRRGCR